MPINVLNTLLLINFKALSVYNYEMGNNYSFNLASYLIKNIILLCMICLLVEVFYTVTDNNKNAVIFSHLIRTCIIMKILIPPSGYCI